MTPLRLRITNFRSFAKTQEFVFPDGPGLFFLWGENKEEPRLEANGSGKSSLWKALTWLFYGKTSDGLKAGDVANWDVAKGTVVELDFVSPSGEDWTLRRTWSPNSWVLITAIGEVVDQAKDETNYLKYWLSLDFQPFLSCILMAQGQPMFLDLKPEAKAALFAEVMALDRWLKYSESASKQASEADRQLRQLESTVADLQGRLYSAKSVDMKTQVDDWEAGRQLRIRSLEVEYKNLVQRHTDLKDRLASRIDEEVQARAEYKIALECVEDAEAQLKRARGGAYDAQGSHPCPTCGQKVSDAMAILIDKLSAAKSKARSALQYMDDMTAAVRNCDRDILSIDKALDGLEEREDQLLTEVNPYSKMKDDSQRVIAELEEDVTSAMNRLDSTSARVSLMSSWVRWFKEIRLGLIGDALEELEIEVNSCVSALGLTDWELRFAVDSETAKGTILKGFSVSVLSPHNPKPVPWEAWSGGESQRLRLATNMGLANLIRARTGTTLQLEVWDEPTQWMSGQGVTDLLDSLATRAETEQRQIWVVDHRTLGYAGFTGTAGVVKTSAGSTFSQAHSYSSETRTPSAATTTVPDTTQRKTHDGPRRRAVS